MIALYKLLYHLEHCLLILIVCLGNSYVAKAQVITTIAGTGAHAETGNGGLAVNAGAPDPYGVCVNAKGDVFFGGANVVRKIDGVTGIVTRFAGTGTSDYSGDGGLATAATMKFPDGLCADANGNIYIAEYAGHRVRKVNAATNIITTVAGTGFEGFNGDNDLATNASLDEPHGICTDSKGNLYISDTKNSRIRKVDAATNIITTIAGNGSTTHSGDDGLATLAGVPYPVSVCTDINDNLYFVEVYSSYTCRVRKIDHTTGIVTTIAGYNSYAYSGDGGLAVNASLFDPTGVSVDKDGNVYISEYDDSRIRKIDAATGIINTLAGTGESGYNGDCIPAAGAKINEPVSLCVDDNKNVYIADTYNNRIRKIIQSAVIGTSSITIKASSTDACTNNSITFTATINNADDNSTLQWKKNDQNVGSNSTFYTDKCKPGDIVTCTLTSSNICNTNTVSGNSITLTGGSIPLPVVTISSDKTSVCEGSSVTFTAVNKSNSENPVYDWLVNGKEVGSNGATFITSTLPDNATVSCIMSAPTCGGINSSISNAISITVSSSLTPAISITTPKANVCRESEIIFTATARNAGSQPSYQWKINGADAGINSPQLSTVALTDNDVVVSCTLTVDASETCFTSASVLSNTITVKTTPKLDGGYFHIIPSASSVCAGDNVSFTSDFVLPGSGSFTWQINGTDITTFPSYSIFTTNALKSGDQVRCIFNSDDPCTPVSISDTINMTVNPTPVITLLPADTAVTAGSQLQLTTSVSGDILTYTWTQANQLISSQTLTPLTVPLSSSTVYTLRVTNGYHCEATASVKVKVIYNLPQMPSSFTPNGDGMNDVYRIPPPASLNLKSFSIYNRWGHILFTTTDPANGWDGTCHHVPLETGTYIYTIQATNELGPIFQKGTVLLIR